MSRTVRLLSSIAVLGCVATQGFYDDHHHQVAHLQLTNGIPKQFVIEGHVNSNPTKEFDKYAKQIHHFAKNQNVSVIYKIQVEIVKNSNTKRAKKLNKQKLKAKKYNIPLKKNSMKLSNFEVFLRKTAEDNNHFPSVGGPSNLHTSPAEIERPTTKPPHLKYKPIKSKLRNFAKVIRPVRNNIITLS